MKILWFTNIMLPEFASTVGGECKNINGWLSSLVSAIRLYGTALELTVVSEGPCKVEKMIAGINYISLGTFRYKRIEGIPSHAFAHAVKTCIEKIKPDIIHVHGTEGVFAAMPSWVWGNAKKLVSVQGIILGYCAYFMGGIADDELECNRSILRKLFGLTTVNDMAQIWRKRRGGIGEKRCFSNFLHYLGRTDWDRAWVEYLQPDARYHEVGEVLRPEFFSVRHCDEQVLPHSIYCSASVTYPLKGGHWLLYAVASLKKKYRDIKLTIAAGKKVLPVKGWRSKLHRGEYDEFLWSQIVRLGLQENVRLLPNLTAQEVAKELSHTELFVLPSMIENSPNSLGEAMLSGVPCVATYVGGVPSILKNEVEGLLVPSGDPASLAAAIDRMFSDKVFAQICAENAYQTALQRYDPKRVVGQLISAYNEVLQG